MKQYKKPQLIQLLQQLSVHDRQSALDMLLQYPELADMVAKFFVMNKAGVSSVILKQFETDCLVRLKK